MHPTDSTDWFRAALDVRGIENDPAEGATRATAARTETAKTCRQIAVLIYALIAATSAARLPEDVRIQRDRVIREFGNFRVSLRPFVERSEGQS